MRLAVQQLLAGPVDADRRAKSGQCAAEELPVGVGQLGGSLPVVDFSQCQGDSIGDMRCVQVDPAQGGMVPQERVRVVGRSDPRSHRFVVRPERDGEGVTHMDAGVDPGVELGHGSVDAGEDAGDRHFELGIGQMARGGDPGQHTARDEMQRDTVRVVDDDHVVDLQAQLRGGRPCRLDRAAELRRLHDVLPCCRAHHTYAWGVRAVRRKAGATSSPSIPPSRR